MIKLPCGSSLGISQEKPHILFSAFSISDACELVLAAVYLFVFLNFSLFLPLASLRRGKRKAFPVSDMWFGYQKEELLEATHGNPHRFKKSSVSALSIPVCSQGQSQIPHEGKPPADGPHGEAGTARALAHGPVQEASRQERGPQWSLRNAVLIVPMSGSTKEAGGKAFPL